MTALLVFLCLTAQVPPADLRQQVLDRGIAAESDARWNDALIIYLDSLATRPDQPELWLRVAEIQARLRHPQDAVRALQQAASFDPSNASTQYRLSQAHAAAGNVRPALEAIERALAIEPGSIEYLRAHATLATWAGKYGAARESYRHLSALAPADTTIVLELARVSAWAGSTDEAAREYRKYLDVNPDAPAVWLELAKTESWRGNFPAALQVLDRYRERFGESPEYSRERAATLARGGRPRAAIDLIDRLPGALQNDDLQLSKTVALAELQRRTEARSTLDTVKSRQPDEADLRGVGRLLRAAIASTAEPRGTTYQDSDGLRVHRFTPRVSLALLNSTRVEGGYERTDLRAREGSGLEQPGGAVQARQNLGWLGATGRAGAWSLSARAGYASIERRQMAAYGLGMQFHPTDTLRLSAARDRGFLVVSPRTVGLGLTRVAHSAQLSWMPALNYTVMLEGSVEKLSDGNRRWDVLFAPRRIVARTERLNLDLGVQVRQFGATTDLDNGYYDPHRYESYALTAFPYWKIGENIGLAMTLALGGQRDDAWRSFRLGGNAAAELTFGIFESWMLKVNGAATLNERTETGAFRAYGGGIVLVRRF